MARLSYLSWIRRLGLPGMSGIEGVRILKERYPQMQILMLTVYDDDDRIFDALCAGGYLLKRTPPAKCLEKYSRGDEWRSTGFAGSGAGNRSDARPAV
jgi:DNA-binding NarL/FixJ family response regulator